jgi:hypothetical protein
MSNTISMLSLVTAHLGLEPSKPPTLSNRSLNIIKHYQAEAERGHMDRNTALERCLGDLAGRNYKADLEQRMEVRI